MLLRLGGLAGANRVRNVGRISNVKGGITIKENEIGVESLFYQALVGGVEIRGGVDAERCQDSIPNTPKTSGASPASGESWFERRPSYKPAGVGLIQRGQGPPRPLI